MSTPYHSQYFAHALTLQRASGSIDNLSRSIANARVDLNPHQVDAAMFALRSPLSNGIMAKQIEQQLKQRTIVQPVFCVKWRMG